MEETAQSIAITGFCVKCKKAVPITNGVMSKTKRNVNILKGVCATCGTKVCRMMRKER